MRFLLYPVAAAMAAATMLIGSGPVEAAPAVLSPAVNTGGTAGTGAFSACAAVLEPGLGSSHDYLLMVEASGPAMATAVGVVCEVREGGPTGTLYSSISGTVSAPVAASEGTISLPATAMSPVLCVYLSWRDASGVHQQPAVCG